MKARLTGWRASFVVLGAIVGAGLAAGTAAAAPARQGIVVAVGARCRVLLTKVSYDDPAADDAEFIELHVEPVSPMASSGAPSPSMPDGSAVPDSGPRQPFTDAGAGSGTSTLGDCGLDALELVNGGGGACDVYRTLALSAVAIPADAYVTVCATDSTLATSRCDVTAAGRSALRNGWLQNGPADGFRFREADGAAVEFAYEGALGCFGPTAARLVDETGQVASSPQAPAGTESVDDVNTACDGTFVLLPLGLAKLRSEASCPPATTETRRDAGDGAARELREGGAGPGAAAADASPPPPERAPLARPRSPGSIQAALGVDAGLVAVARPPLDLPEPPGCSTIGRRDAPSRALRPVGLVLLVGMGVALRQWRRARSH